MSDMGTPDWAGAYLDHFERVLGTPSNRDVFRNERFPAIQVLTYDHVFEGCQTFTTIGATQFFDELGEIAELFTAADSHWAEIPTLLAVTLGLMIEEQIPLTRGVAIRGIRHCVPQLAASTGKNAVYFAIPPGMPDGFTHVIRGKKGGHVYMLLLISDAEYAYYDEHGYEAFEDLLEEHEVDPFELARPSCVATA